MAQPLLSFHDIDSDYTGYVRGVKARSVVERVHLIQHAYRDGLLDGGEYSSVHSVRKAK
jgi:hypothetical protein